MNKGEHHKSTKPSWFLHQLGLETGYKLAKAAS